MDQQNGIDPADQWVFDPATDSYHLRLEGVGGAPRPRRQPAPAEPVRPPGPGRAATRVRRRAEQRRSAKGRIPAWAGTTAALAIIAGGVGVYLLYGHSAAACTTASPATASPTASRPTGAGTTAGTSAEARAAKLLSGPMAAPIDVRVSIYNGTGTFGASQAVLSRLQNSNGVTRSTNAGPASRSVATTTLDYAPNQADQARRLAKMMDLPATALREGTKDAAFRAPMTLTLGRDFISPGRPFSTPTPMPTAAQTHPVASASSRCTG